MYKLAHSPLYWKNAAAVPLRLYRKKTVKPPRQLIGQMRTAIPLDQYIKRLKMNSTEGASRTSQRSAAHQNSLRSGRAPLQAAGYLRHSVEILPTGRRSKLWRITQLAMKSGDKQQLLAEQKTPITYDDVMAALVKKYGNTLDGLGTGSAKYKYIITGRLLDMLRLNGKDLGVLKGKNVLDLGCGSENYRCFEDFYPWVSRFLHEIGANVTGIDINEQCGEFFASHALDLLKKDALAFLESGSFDIIVCFNLLPPEGTDKGNISPTLEDMITQLATRDSGYRTSQPNALENKMVQDMGLEIKLQATRLLKEQGMLLWESHVYVKHDGQLVRKS